MKKKDASITINNAIWKETTEKLQQLFGKKLKKTEVFQMTILLALFLLNKNGKDLTKNAKEVYESLLKPSDVVEEPPTFTIAVFPELLEQLVDNWTKQIKSKSFKNSLSRNDIVGFAFAIVATTDIDEYLEPLEALYKFTGYKNPEMQSATASAVSAMNLPTQDLTLVEVCCGSAALTLGLNPSRWKQIILNDMDPLKTNFLNVLINEPVKLIDAILEEGINYKKGNVHDKEIIDVFIEEIDAFAKKREKYNQVACDTKIAAHFFLCACTTRNFREKWLTQKTILQRLLCFLPASLKLRYSHAIVTQRDALDFLDNKCTISIPHDEPIFLDCNRFLLSDTPYPGSEKYSGLKNYKYERFHRKVAEKLTNADYPFLYFCRSTAPKGDSRPIDVKNHSMKLLLAQLFFNKGFYHDKVHLTWNCLPSEDGSTTESATELLISNQRYSNTQFLWNRDDQDLT